MTCKCCNTHESAGFRRGDVVAVRSLEEILATLDADSKLDGLPFMPEMVPFCGQEYRVFRRAEKTCVEGVGIRSMTNTVFLEGLRCDGSAHDGCQRGCLFFWNEAWLRNANDECGTMNDERPKEGNREQGREERGEGEAVRSTEYGVRSGSGRGTGGESSIPHSSFLVQHSLANPPSQNPNSSTSLPTTKGDRYFCQSTELAGATGQFTSGKLQLYLHDLRVGEISVWRFIYVLWLAATNRVWHILHGRGFYQITGEQTKTLNTELNLQPGELVEIKSTAEIEATLDARGRNRGLSFEPEMALHCGRRYRVATPVRRIIAEETGKMVQLSNTVILDGLICQGICAKNCPRANFFYWREIWLKRV